MKKKWLILISIVVFLPFIFYWSTHLKEIEKLKNKHAKRDGPYFELHKITRFSKRWLPYINVEIEGNQIEGILDLGDSGIISLGKELIDNIKGKTTLDVTTSYGLRGEKYQSNQFEFSEIKLGKATLSRPRGNEINLEFEADAEINPSENETFIPCSARIGWRFFNRLNLYLDCKKSVIAICDSIETLQKNGYLLDCIEMTLLSIGHGIGFEAMTDQGSLRCLLDTGCSHNIFHSYEPESINDAFKNPKNRIKFKSFKMGSQDFGEIRFIRAPFKARKKIDAIIGMDFIYSRQIFIDFSKRKIYFSLPTRLQPLLGTGRKTSTAVGLE